MTAHAPHPGINSLSALSQADFVAALEGIFEHSDWVAERAWHRRPFADAGALHAALLASMFDADEATQLALIRAHPELAGKEAAAGALTQASTGEQRGAGLDQCSPDELARLRALNARYRERFGFPFVIAVKGLSRDHILDAIESRLGNDRATEFHTCLQEIGKIAGFRLHARLTHE